MKIFVSDPVFQTALFILVFVFALAISLRFRSTGSFGKNTTNELKGFAILAILFSHIGYFLADDTRFLFPLSVLAGVGVDLFLFLSGFGLTTSMLAKPLSVPLFYAKRLTKLFIPLWITLALFFTLDAVFLNTWYGWHTVLESALGWFTRAEVYDAVNSPLWYITLILFYYLVFPLLFSRKAPYASALGIYALSYAIIQSSPSFILAVLPLYELHLLAFPLGMLGAIYFGTKESFGMSLSKTAYYTLLAVLAGAIGYLAIHSGVGKVEWIAEGMSLITVFLIIAFFIFKRFEVNLLKVFGGYSYEIYLFHWPLLYRYDFFFSTLPAWLALSLYLVFFLLLARLLRALEEKVLSLSSAPRSHSRANTSES